MRGILSQAGILPPPKKNQAPMSNGSQTTPGLNAKDQIGHKMLLSCKSFRMDDDHCPASRDAVTTIVILARYLPHSQADQPT